MLRLLTISVLLMTAAVLAGCSSGGDEADHSHEGEELAASVEDWSVSAHEVEQLLATLPEQQRVKYDTPGGRAELADRLIEEELYYREGLKLNLENDAAIKEAIKNYTRTLVVQAYFNRNIEPLAAPKEEELRDFYDNNEDTYTKMPIARAQHIFSKNHDKLVELKERIIAGEKMTSLAQKYSEDEMTRDDGGDLGYFNPDGYIRSVGYSKEISDAAFTMEPGVVSDPIKWKKGWSIIRVNEMRPAQRRPYDEVREDIYRMFTSQRIDRIKADAFDVLKGKYDTTNHLEEKLRLTQRTPEELWNLAQNSSDSYQRLRSYEEIVDKFPESDYAAQAMFMIGFVHAEELKDNVEADRAFTQVLNRWPDSEVAKSAEWMLENMNKPVPKFETLDELNDKLSDESE